jgi:hypothetical protein
VKTSDSMCSHPPSTVATTYATAHRRLGASPRHHRSKATIASVDVSAVIA